MTFAYKLIDLTHTVDEHIPTWNADCGFTQTLTLDYSDCQGVDKFRVMKFHMHAGIGTHMDAPSHCIEGAKSVSDLEINELCMPCVVIDISSKAKATYSLSKEDIITFEKHYGAIDADCCVMIKTGWDKFWPKPEYHNNHWFPCVSIEAAHYLLEKNVAALGIDTLSPDRPHDGFKVHQAFLGAGKFLIENVTNLDKMPPTGSFVMALPIKIQAATEAPIRLVGLLKKSNK